MMRLRNTVFLIYSTQYNEKVNCTVKDECFSALSDFLGQCCRSSFDAERTSSRQKSQLALDCRGEFTNYIQKWVVNRGSIVHLWVHRGSVTTCISYTIICPVYRKSATTAPFMQRSCKILQLFQNANFQANIVCRQAVHRVKKGRKIQTVQT
jgi:hypothetical protein